MKEALVKELDDSVKRFLSRMENMKGEGSLSENDILLSTLTIGGERIVELLKKIEFRGGDELPKSVKELFNRMAEAINFEAKRNEIIRVNSQVKSLCDNIDIDDDEYQIYEQLRIIYQEHMICIGEICKAVNIECSIEVREVIVPTSHGDFISTYDYIDIWFEGSRV